jgi:hypothetical protein
MPPSDSDCVQPHRYLAETPAHTVRYPDKPTLRHCSSDSRFMSRIIILVASAAIISCAVTEDNLALVEQAHIMPNGLALNGILHNHIMPNDIRINGVLPTGTMPNGRLIGVSGTEAPLTGADIVGSQWEGRLSDNTTIKIRIDAAMQLTGANSDVWSYQFSGETRGGEWVPLCGITNGVPTFADTVGGTWNLSQGVPGGGAYRANSAEFTIACRGSAIAKCLELGYKPWTGNQREIATCVRAVRADYCGDGTPYTVDGTLVNLFDASGIQTDDADWTPEAAWGPDGALCVSKKAETRFWQVLHTKPTCYPHALKRKKSCGTEFSEGAAIITELEPR